MLRNLSTYEISLVAGGMGDSDDFDDGGFFSDNNFSDQDSGGGDSPQLSEYFGNLLNDDNVSFNTPNENDVVVTAPLNSSQVAAMESQAEYMTDAELIVIGAGSGAAGAAAGLGVGASAVLGGATAAVTGHLTTDQMNAMNFNYLYNTRNDPPLSGGPAATAASL